MQFNVESEAELNALNEVAGEMGIKAPIALRVNPDVDAKTHAKISTGKKENKFGIPIDQAPALYKKASSLNNINVKSVSTHIGSQLLDINPFREAFLRVMSLVADLKNDGHNIDTIDFGGGIGITYSDENNISLESYAKMINEVTENFDGKVVFEPGRLIAGNAGILVSEVIYTKPTDARNFVIIDAAMNDLIRPSMYGAHHDIIPVQKAKSTDIEQDFVGPVCETGDTFAEQRKSAAVKSGELIAIRSCGAYGAVMSNEYNTRPLIPEVLVNGEKFAVIRKRPSYDEILQRDLIPNW